MRSERLEVEVCSRCGLLAGEGEGGNLVGDDSVYYLCPACLVLLETEYAKLEPHLASEYGLAPYWDSFTDGTRLELAERRRVFKLWLAGGKVSR